MTCLNLSFVKDIKIVIKKMAINGRKMAFFQFWATPSTQTLTAKTMYEKLFHYPKDPHKLL